MKDTFLGNTTLLSYNAKEFNRELLEDAAGIVLNRKQKQTVWLNTYGLEYQNEFKTIIDNNELDDFLTKLISEKNHPNKIIALEDILFVTIKVLKTENSLLKSEQMMFVSSANFIWSIQEHKGDYFNWIRERLENNNGLVRKKKGDYLLYLILESMIDNYQTTFEKYGSDNLDPLKISRIKSTPEFTQTIERKKHNLFKFKKAVVSLRDSAVKLEKIEVKDMNPVYYSEIKEQANNLISDIDFELQKLESKINLIFSTQGHRLNEVMKTLTIFSVIFIPLTFIAGIYGMNFENMPELKTHNGYFILLGSMLLITIISIWVISKKKWF